MSALARLLDLIVPSTCAGCELPGPIICSACADALRPGTGIPCATCGHPWPVAVARCAECPAPLLTVRHLCRYDDTARAVISSLKDRGRTAVAPELARLMAAAIPAPPEGVPLVPVPLADRRRRRRGFNQAELLARELGRLWGRPVHAPLRRVDGGPPQRGASRSDRTRQVRGAFSVDASAPVTRGAAILVDDVLTTGATLGACARALRRGGWARVGAVVVARAEATADGSAVSDGDRPPECGWSPVPDAGTI